MTVAELESMRNRVLPMLQLAAAEYRYRVPEGYPVVVDSPERGSIGLQIDPSFSLMFTSDGRDVWAEFMVRQARTDTRSSASREKFAGEPAFDRRKIDASISDLELRNLIAELMSRWNFQPSIIHITDT